MSKNTICWLHLSDFHIGKDPFGQHQVYRYILEHVRDRGVANHIPQFVFITGDIANKGLDEQYKDFFENFYNPLKSLLPNCEIYVVPGNHDLDHTKQRCVARDTIRKKTHNFFDADENGAAWRFDITPRFEAFIKWDKSPNTDLNDTTHWLKRPEGVFTIIRKLGDLSVGIVGLNTAWLSEVDEEKKDSDRLQVTPGKPLLEKGLIAIRDCSVRIVLGHHPIHWFHSDDQLPIMTMLGRYGVLYLHGHLHRNDQTYFEGGGFGYRSFQAGSAFQARENDIWKNRLVWCEVEIENARLHAQPFEWSRDHQAWVIDFHAYGPEFREPRGDRWTFPLPGKKDTSKLVSLSGWQLVNQAVLEAHRQTLDDRTVLSYFDGRIPSLSIALSPLVPRRCVVGEVVTEFEERRNLQRPLIILLTGPGGEGKSTALLQIMAALVESSQGWKSIWWTTILTGLSEDLVNSLPKGEGVWLIVADDADLIADNLFKVAKSVQISGRCDVHLLLASRDTDWYSANKGKQRWRYEFQNDYKEKLLRGLDEPDANMIISSWSRYGREGLGELDGLTHTKAVMRLTHAAKEEVTTSKKEGAFLGAMLRVRKGTDLKQHVAQLLYRLETRTVISDEKHADGKTLRDALTYIAVMHAKDRRFLSKSVLARVMGCDLQNLAYHVLAPLGDEAMAIGAGNFVITRHRAIAETIVDILSEDHIDLDNYYVDLVQTVQLAMQEGEYIDEVREWRSLPQFFFETGDRSLGIRLAQAAAKVSHTSEHAHFNLAQLYIEADQTEMALETLRGLPPISRILRGFYIRYAKVEFTVRNFASAAWLAWIALADKIERRFLNKDQAKGSLIILARALTDLSKVYSNSTFYHCCRAVVQMFMTLEPDPAMWYKTHEAAMVAETADVKAMGLVDSFKHLRSGMLIVSNQLEDDLPVWFPHGKDLSFTELADLLGIERRHGQ